jgi:hypothetical protein
LLTYPIFTLDAPFTALQNANGSNNASLSATIRLLLMNGGNCSEGLPN